MSGYLTKPIERDRLADVLSVWLQREDAGISPAQDGATTIGGASLVDQSILDDLEDQIGSANLTRVVDKFLDELGRRWQALESAKSSDDLSREAHTLASTCRSFGLPSLAEKLACIERHARFGDAAGEPPCLAEMGRELSEGAAALQSAVQLYRDRP